MKLSAEVKGNTGIREASDDDNINKELLVEALFRSQESHKKSQKKFYHVIREIWDWLHTLRNTWEIEKYFSIFFKKDPIMTKDQYHRWHYYWYRKAG